MDDPEGAPRQEQAGMTNRVSFSEVSIYKIEEGTNSIYPLWGTIYKYDDPFDSAISYNDWELLK
ncbi:MAG: hypothetical protein WBQ38_15925 [Ignavibacteria bacterium]|nr:hypothetical protein [Ignavibacteria bacterium]MBK7445306.1 hypothetical protein [Ignavibacteria bacterium]MBK8383128.1 hypothetical protein [Ignavibacteria bacterium]MBK9402976.1 hypothetical protein [Ignavibacteria bacterium]MBL0107711.1 hypothetical protein [Ignavibacteria bacterium]